MARTVRVCTSTNAGTPGPTVLPGSMLRRAMVPSSGARRTESLRFLRASSTAWRASARPVSASTHLDLGDRPVPVHGLEPPVAVLGALVLRDRDTERVIERRRRQPGDDLPALDALPDVEEDLLDRPRDGEAQHRRALRVDGAADAQVARRVGLLDDRGLDDRRRKRRRRLRAAPRHGHCYQERGEQRPPPWPVHAALVRPHARPLRFLELCEPPLHATCRVRARRKARARPTGAPKRRHGAGGSAPVLR